MKKRTVKIYIIGRKKPITVKGNEDEAEEVLEFYLKYIKGTETEDCITGRGYVIPYRSVSHIRVK